ncbi:RDD family protein [Lysobacter firmicutimachus]|uniref:RDD family protein n=1 Tax=Lysobacter firmicutimachus TaxID=1792846 RepID=A0ABU8DAR3_9GAMM
MEEQHNPYHAPQAAVAVSERIGTLVDAGRGRRLANHLIDTVAMLAMMFVGAMGYGLVAGEAAIAALEQPNLARDIGFNIVLMLVYYVPLEGMFGATLGKLVTGTRVVDEQGRPPTWGQVLGRTLCRLIPFEPLSVLFAGLGWHDRLPRTRVVRTR